MDSLQAKRANAISFQLRLRDKTQPVIKNDKPDRFLSGLSSASAALRRITFPGEGGKVATSCIEIEVTIARLSYVDKSCTAVLSEV